MEKPDPEERDHTLLTLPTEILVYIISFVTSLRQRAKLRYVSRRLQNVCETPLLWRKFVWPHYHAEEKGCVNDVMKLCGQHVKYLFFPDLAIPTPQLLRTLIMQSHLAYRRPH